MPPVRSSGCIDPGWEHGVAQDEKKKKVKCNYCGKVVSGGIFRLKQHLARLSGEVTHCERASEEVCLSMRRNLEGCRSGRKRKQSEFEQTSFGFGEEATASCKEKKVRGDKNLVIRFAPLRSLGYVDPGWEHCVAQDDKKKRVKCNYCEKIISGGINRFKQHLARIPGEVACCDKAPEDVYLKMKENMKCHRSGRRPRKPDTREVSAFYMQSDDEDEHEEQDEGFSEDQSKDIICYEEKAFDADIRNISGRRFTEGSSINSPELAGRRSRLDSVFLNTLKSQTLSNYQQGNRKMVLDKRSRKDVLSAISKFFYHAGIPTAAANSPYFHRMLELVGQYGPGLRGPSSQLISGLFLRDEISSSRKYLEELKTTWTDSGCSILADSWKDAQGKIIINLLVSCARGLYFVSSVDATDIVEDAGDLFRLLDGVVVEVGEENIIQVVTKDTSSFRAAGKMLEERRKNIFWTPCAVHSVDEMIDDFLKIRWIGECFEKAKTVTKFVYSHVWVLNYMKKEFTGGKELLMPGITKSLTSFFTIRRLLEHRVGLKRMLQSNSWLSRFSRSEVGNEVEKIVLNAAFWKRMQCVKRSFEPIVQVLQRIVRGESLPCVYNEMYRARLAIKAIHGEDVRRYGPLWNVMDNYWISLFHHPLYVAAYFLNPAYRYRHDFITHPEVIHGLNECIVRLEPDCGRRSNASMQISEFVSAKADFGTDLAISTRTELDPASWWQQHGICCPELQRIAIWLLSQTCSSIGCEHSWSIYDQLHSCRHNRLSQKRWDDLTYVHYNLRLREPLVGGDTDDILSFESGISENILHDWIGRSGKQLDLDDEVLYDEMEHFYKDDDDENRCEDKRHEEMVTMGTDVEHSVINRADETGSTDDDEDDDELDFLDDGGTGME